MFGIELFNATGLLLEWSTIYYGIKKNILGLDIVKDYIYWKMEADEPLLEQEQELLCCLDNQLEIIKLIEDILKSRLDNNDSFEIEREKIRDAIIMYLRKMEMDTTKLLQKVELVYSEFDYPEDMEKFIAYMPVSGERTPSRYSLAENREYLLSQIDAFIREKETKYKLDK